MQRLFAISLALILSCSGCVASAPRWLAPAHLQVGNAGETTAAVFVIMAIPVAFSLDLTLLWLAAMDGHTFEPFWITRTLLELLDDLL